MTSKRDKAGTSRLAAAYPSLDVLRDTGSPGIVSGHGPHERAVSVWYHTAGLASRNRKDLSVEIIEAEIRSA